MGVLLKIQERIDLIDPLLVEITTLPLCSQLQVPGVLTGYLGESSTKQIRLSEKIAIWQAVTSTIVATICGESDPYLMDFDIHWRAPMRGLDFVSEMTNKLEQARSDLKILYEVVKARGGESVRVSKKIKTLPPKIFISHEKEDHLYADALVNLINFIIGPSGDKIFCSSIPGYGIRLSRDIMDELRAQFDNYDIFMIIIHSPRYYNSAVCLNEMGASWVLGTKFSSFMTKDCTYDQMRGVIGREKICINLNDDSKLLNSHLNDFKEDILSFFRAKPLDENKWEYARARFIDEVIRLNPI